MGAHTPGPWQVLGEDDLPASDDLMIVAFDVSGDNEGAEGIYVCNVGSDGGRYGSLAPSEHRQGAGGNPPRPLPRCYLARSSTRRTRCHSSRSPRVRRRQRTPILLPNGRTRPGEGDEGE